MKHRLRRFAAVASAVTAVDLAVFLWLHLGSDWPVAAAGAGAIAVAAVLSYALNRAVTFAGDPYVRWVRWPGLYVAIVLGTGAVDVAVLTAAVAVTDAESAVELLLCRAVALAVAAPLRFLAYRWMLFADVHREQATPAGRPPPPGDVRLTVVVPAYREGERIGAAVEELRTELATVAASGGLEIVVVDDGSADDTAARALEAGADQVAVHPTNRGKGAAVRTGVLAARGRTIAFTDADVSYPPEQLLRLLEEIESGWDVVVGSRRHVETVTLVRARRLREVSGRLFNLLTSAVLLGRYRDTQCGLKAFRADVARLVFSRSRLDGFAFDVEILHLVERYGLSLCEVPVSLVSASTSTVRIGRDAARMLRDLFRIRRWAGQGRYDLDEAEASRWRAGRVGRTN